MERVDFNLGKAQRNFLENLPGTLSEHIRRAIDEYIDRLRFSNVSSSQSKRKEENG